MGRLASIGGNASGGRMLIKHGRISPLVPTVIIKSQQVGDAESRRIKTETGDRKKRAVVVGGGWAGFGAAHTLLKAGMDVTVVEAGQEPGGLSSGFRTPAGRAVEAGIKGFWYQYRNIEALVRELGIESPFTPYTRSSFYSPAGLEVEAPLFQSLPRLPTPLGSFLYTSPYFRRLPLLDRLTAVPLVTALLEHDVDQEAYTYYDGMSAQDLFLAAGVSPRLYCQFLEPILLVTLFAPAAELSAAAALGALYYFALAHQADFDVRWCTGSVVDKIFKPWRERLQALGGRLLFGRRVSRLEPGPDGTPVRVRVISSDGGEEAIDGDVFVFCVGVRAMQGIVDASPVLAERPEFGRMRGLKTDDVAAVRMWLDKRVTPPTASNVVVGFDVGVGATFFDLNSLQEEYRGSPGSVVEVDLYHAGALLGLSDDEILQRLLYTYLATSVPAYRSTNIIDASVLRFPKAVTAFSPGSHPNMPSVSTSLGNVFVAADWVAQGPGTHGAKGLSQEKAYVAGLEAGILGARHVALVPKTSIIPVEDDEPHVQVAKEAVRQARSISRQWGFSLPRPFPRY